MGSLLVLLLSLVSARDCSHGTCHHEVSLEKPPRMHAHAHTTVEQMADCTDSEWDLVLATPVTLSRSTPSERRLCLREAGEEKLIC